MGKVNQLLLVIIFYSLMFCHRLLAADSCVIGRVTKVTERLKDLIKESGQFVKQGPRR